jgi:16S rRNA A1518/A1519 N6-dimethyltransferase RsmA/KsgA/DIM1 with predicted DNA glycosylase/AP lyase activity
VEPDDLVVDLGAGGGRLTAELAVVAAHVVAVELDPQWARRLRGRWANVDVLEADAASVPLPAHAFRVVANLPFEGTNPILRHLLDDPSVPLVRADLVVQWGVAVKRALPWPSTVNGAVWRAWYSIFAARRLPPDAFDPPPSVDAGVLVAERRPRPLVPPDCAQTYRRFVATGFRHGLRAVAPGRTLGRLRLTRRQPRHLDAHEWAALFRLCRRDSTTS